MRTVTLRPYDDADAGDMVAAAQESLHEVGRWMPWCHPDYSLADAEQWIATTQAGHRDRSMFDFAVLADGIYSGGCGVNQIRPLDRVANVGYWVRTSLTGRGIATAATKQVIDWAFAETDLVRLEIVVAVGNVASQRVAEKLGAVREAVLRKRVVASGESVDGMMYSIIREDWT